MMSRAIYTVAGIYLFTQGVSGLIQLRFYMQESQAFSTDGISHALYIPALVHVLAAIACFYLGIRTADSHQDTDLMSESRAMFMGLFLMGLFFIINNLPELIHEFNMYRGLKEMGATTGSLDKFVSSMWILGIKSFIGAALLAISTKSKTILYAVRGLGA